MTKKKSPVPTSKITKPVLPFDQRMVGLLDDHIGDEITLIFKPDAIMHTDGTGAKIRGILHASTEDPNGVYMLVVKQTDGWVQYNFDASAVAALVETVDPRMAAAFVADKDEREAAAAKMVDEFLRERQGSKIVS